MNDFADNSLRQGNANCPRCGAAQKPATIYCAKCGTASLRGQSPLVALGLRTAIFFGMLLVVIGLGTLGGCFLLMIYLKRSIYSDHLLMSGASVTLAAAILCIGIMFRLRKL